MQPVPQSAGSGAVAADDHVESVYSKVSWRIMPLLVICYIIAFLDRINIGYAQLQMKQTLPFSDAVYGLGAGIFFIGYFIFEVPSNLMLEKIGARKTLLRIMFCWGIVATGMMFVQTPTQFYVLRFLLGAFEAGFFPGVILYLTYWYPPARRGQMIAIFMTATTLASVIAGPLCGAIMKWMDGINGWHGWQWLFLVQGLPSSVLGLVCFFYLQDKPEQAHWLDEGQKKVLRDHLDHDQGLVAGAGHGSMWQALKDPKVYTLSLVYFLLLGATYTMVFWLPTLIKSWGISDLFMIGIYAAIPNAVGVVGMVLIGRSSDRMKERRWHFVMCTAIAAIGLAVTIFTQGNFAASLVGLCIATVGIASATPLFFTITSEYLSKAAAAGGIALISSLGNLGAAVSPSVTGAINAATGNPVNSMYLVIALYIVAGSLLLWAVKAAAKAAPPRAAMAGT
ncbi:MAG: MFS transporter [Burkholderiaceae bacterium]